MSALAYMDVTFRGTSALFTNPATKKSGERIGHSAGGGEAGGGSVSTDRGDAGVFKIARGGAGWRGQ